jgi:hypothetical protein
MDEGGGGAGTSARRFGACCSELREAMAGQDFEPLITEGDDGVLYVAVGLIHLEDEEPGMVDHPLFFCPFCGAKLQTADEVKGKGEHERIANN